MDDGGGYPQAGGRGLWRAVVAETLGRVAVILPVSRDDDSVLDWLSFEQAGVVTYRQARDVLGPATVRGRVASGRWRRACRGVLVTHNGRLGRGEQLWVAVLAAGPGAVLAGATAAGEAGVHGLPTGQIHVLVPAGRMVTDLRNRLPIDMPGVRIHRTSVLPDAHLQAGRPPRTTLARSVVDAAAWARTDDEARTVIAAACQQRRVTPQQIRSVLTELSRNRRRALVLETVGDVEGGAQALSELDFVRLCRRQRLPPPDLQERRFDAAGRRRYLDAYWRRWGLHVEVDGAHHLDARHWATDMLRQNEVWIAGDRILRFPAWLVRRRPAEVADQVRRALTAAGWQPTAGRS